MPEVERIAHLLAETFEGDAYYGPSVLAALDGVSAATAARMPAGGGHSVWELVAHLTAELRYARELLEGTAVPWVEGQTTWSAVTVTSAQAWDEALRALTQANRAMVHVVEQLDDSVLDQPLTQVRRSYYVMLHGLIQHNVYHAGQISLLKRHLTLT